MFVLINILLNNNTVHYVNQYHPTPLHFRTLDATTDNKSNSVRPIYLSSKFWQGRQIFAISSDKTYSFQTNVC